MKYRSILSLGILLATTGFIAQAQTPGQVLAVSANVAGTLTNNSARLDGCPTLVCTTNMVTFSRCYTNCEWKWVCTTNGSGDVQCTNVQVCGVHCFTNTFPEITCTNVFSTPTTLTLKQSLTGTISSDGCDELGGFNFVFQASFYTTLRTNDWRGSHFGSFKILDGTNVVVYGGLTGINGAGTHRGLEPCGICNHLEGTLRGVYVGSGPLRGSRVQAAYSGNLTDVTCPSTTAPQGAIAMGIEGLATIPCFSIFEPRPGVTEKPTAATDE